VTQGRRLVLAALLGSMSAIHSCADRNSTRSAEIGASHARSVPELDALFHREPRWLGADAALTIPLSSDRILWLFGDTFVATSDSLRRTESRMPRNTIAIQEGRDPRSARISFHWGRNGRGEPDSFFPNAGERFFWPGHGVRFENGPLVIFLFGIVSTPGVGLGFDAAGRALAVIDNPDDPVDRWSMRIVDAPKDPFDAVPALAVVREGEFVVGLATKQYGVHAGALVRYPAATLAKGSLDGEQWWAGESRGWVPADTLGAEGPAFVIDDAGAECSIHWEPRADSFVHVASYGFGASTIGVRTAPKLTGPWSEPTIVFRPPECDLPKPFVYAAKAHPELVAAGEHDLLVTYASNSFDFAELVSPEGTKRLYWPRFVAVPIGPGGDFESAPTGP